MTEDRHVAACRCIWCASDPDKARETLHGAPSASHDRSGADQARNPNDPDSELANSIAPDQGELF